MQGHPTKVVIFIEGPLAMYNYSCCVCVSLTVPVSLIIIIIPVVSSQFLLTSSPSSLEGAELCQENNIIVNLQCKIKDLQLSVFLWFLCEDECTAYALATPAFNGLGSVKIDDGADAIAGVEITIDTAVRTGEMRLSVNSTMSLDLSNYSTDQVRTFRCGRANSPNPESNPITLNFTITSM